jgi:hypothetical protein
LAAVELEESSGRRQVSTTGQAAHTCSACALADGITLLDLTRTHHAVVGPILVTAAPRIWPSPREGRGFLVEALAPYDIAGSGFSNRPGRLTDRPPGRRPAQPITAGSTASLPTATARARSPRIRQLVTCPPNLMSRPGPVDDAILARPHRPPAPAPAKPGKSPQGW